MKNYVDTILQEIQEDRTTGAVELVKKEVHTIALFISHLSLNLKDFKL